MEIEIPNYLNMHKSRHKFTKKKNKCDMTIKSTITKRTISSRKKVVETIKKIHQKRNKIGERERVLSFFVVDNLEGIGKRGGNEVKRNLFEN